MTNAVRWRAIRDYDGRYVVSDHGEVKTLVARAARKAGYTLKQRISGRGYMYVELSQGGVTKPHMIHRLVADAFIGARPANFQVNHKDGIKTNNRASNLEYVTASDNSKHAVRLGLIDMSKPTAA